MRMDDDMYVEFMNFMGAGNQGPVGAGNQAIEEAVVVSDRTYFFDESSDTSVDMEVPGNVVEIVPLGDNMYQPVGDMLQPVIKPVVDSKFEVGVSDSSTNLPTSYILERWLDHELVRNVALAGHLHHGKTVFMDMLVEKTHKIYTFDENTEKHMGFTDTRKDEQEREMSIKAVPMSLVLVGSNSYKPYLCNIMDTVMWIFLLS